MKHLGFHLGIAHNVEILLLSLIGITFSVFDTSLFTLKANIQGIWSLTFNAEKFSEDTQYALKYVLTNIELVRTLSVHLYLAFYIVMLWPAIFEDRPKLIIPWLVVGASRCLATVAAYGCGMYICGVYHFQEAVCYDFMIAEFIEYGPSFYMWLSVLYFYKYLRDVEKTLIEIQRQRDGKINDPVFRRKRSKNLYKDNVWESSALLKLQEDSRHLISVSTIENALNHIPVDSKSSHSRSLDSLLQNLAVEAEKQEIMTMNDDVREELDVDESLTVSQKIAKILEISPSYILKVQQARGKRHNDNASEIIPDGNTEKTRPGRPKYFSETNPPKINPEEVENKESSVCADTLSIKSSELELSSIDINSESNQEVTGPTKVPIKKGSKDEKPNLKSKPSINHSKIPQILNKKKSYMNSKTSTSLDEHSLIESSSSKSTPKAKVMKSSNSTSKTKSINLSDTSKLSRKIPVETGNKDKTIKDKIASVSKDKLKTVEVENEVNSNERPASAPVHVAGRQLTKSPFTTAPDANPLQPTDGNVPEESRQSEIRAEMIRNFKPKTSSFQEDGFTIAYYAKQNNINIREAVPE